ncbi:hypothetical protein FACS1894186_0370 [Alphaproteobacteria bacterium]|nr:hypothetical protein FACS1894186_0370 [Alphaproteobacteria bacterium]
MRWGSKIILPDSTEGAELGFTSDRFVADSADGCLPGSYLTLNSGVMWVSAIYARRPKTGDFRRLMTNIQAEGWPFIIPAPSLRMREIGLKQGWWFYQTMGGLRFLSGGNIRVSR